MTRSREVGSIVPLCGSDISLKKGVVVFGQIFCSHHCTVLPHSSQKEDLNRNTRQFALISFNDSSYLLTCTAGLCALDCSLRGVEPNGDIEVTIFKSAG